MLKQKEKILMPVPKIEEIILNLVKKLTGSEESPDETAKFLEKLKGKSEGKTLSAPQSL